MVEKIEESPKIKEQVDRVITEAAKNVAEDDWQKRVKAFSIEVELAQKKFGVQMRAVIMEYGPDIKLVDALALQKVTK